MLKIPSNGWWSWVALAAAILLGGCARYEFVLVEPSQLAGTIGKEGFPVPYEPLTYRLAKRHDRIAMTISNSTDSPVMLVGNKSYVVDPGGQTRPLIGGTIAPRSHIGLFLPPEPQVYRAGPILGPGFGYYYGSGPYFGPGFGYYYEPFYALPMYYYLENAPHYWEWKTGQVQMRLFYEQTHTNTFEHHFVFLRQKVRK